MGGRGESPESTKASKPGYAHQQKPGLSIQGDRLTKDSAWGNASVRNGVTNVCQWCRTEERLPRASLSVTSLLLHLSVTCGFWSACNLSVSLNSCLPVCGLCSPFVKQHGQHGRGRGWGYLTGTCQFYKGLHSTDSPDTN